MPIPKHSRRIYPDLKTFFEKAGVTQEEFARQINRSQSWVSKVRNGQLEPSIADALLIVDVAGVPLESLIKHTRELSA